MREGKSSPSPLMYKTLDLKEAVLCFYITVFMNNCFRKLCFI